MRRGGGAEEEGKYNAEEGAEACPKERAGGEGVGGGRGDWSRFLPATVVQGSCRINVLSHSYCAEFARRGNFSPGN